MRYGLIATKAVFLPILIMIALGWATAHQATNPNLDLPPMGDKTDFVPTWTDSLAEQFPNCRDASKVKRFAKEVLVFKGTRPYRESFDTAWATNHDANESNNVWVVGKCF